MAVQIRFETKNLRVLFAEKPLSLKNRLLNTFNNGGWQIKPADLNKPNKLQMIREKLEGLRTGETEQAAIQALAQFNQMVAELESAAEQAANQAKAAPVAPPPTPEDIVLTEAGLLAALESGKPQAAKAALEKFKDVETFERPIALQFTIRNKWNQVQEDAELETLLNNLFSRVAPDLHIQAGGEVGEHPIPDKNIFLSTQAAGRKKNEDGMIYFNVRGKDYLAVADGVGGSAAGEIASWIALETVAREIENGNSLKKAIKRASAAVIEFQQEHASKLKDEGIELKREDYPASTIVLIEMDGDKARIAHAGDSLVYLAKEDGTIALLTLPHSFSAEMVVNNLKLAKDSASYGEDIIEAIRVKQESMRNGEMRQFANNIISFVGLENIEVALTEIELQPGERLLAFTDGLEALSFAKIKKILTRSNGHSVEEIGRELMDKALESKPKDNITVALIEREKILSMEEMEVVEIEAEPAKDAALGGMTAQYDMSELAPASRHPELTAALDEISLLKQQLSAAEIAARSAQSQAKTRKQKIETLTLELREHQRNAADIAAARAMAGTDKGVIGLHFQAIEERINKLIERREEIKVQLKSLTPQKEELSAAIGQKSIEISEASHLVESQQQAYKDKIAAAEQATTRRILKSAMAKDPIITEGAVGLQELENEKASLKEQLDTLVAQIRTMESQIEVVRQEAKELYAEFIEDSFERLRGLALKIKIPLGSDIGPVITSLENGEGKKNA